MQQAQQLFLLQEKVDSVKGSEYQLVKGHGKMPLCLWIPSKYEYVDGSEIEFWDSAKKKISHQVTNIKQTKSLITHDNVEHKEELWWKAKDRILDKYALISQLIDQINQL